MGVDGEASGLEPGSLYSADLASTGVYHSATRPSEEQEASSWSCCGL